MPVIIGQTNRSNALSPIQSPVAKSVVVGQRIRLFDRLNRKRFQLWFCNSLPQDKIITFF